MGFHVQRTVPNWLDGVMRLPDSGLVKATEDYQMFREVKEINANIFTVHRMVRDGWQNYDGQYNDWETAKRCVRDWFNAFVDGTFRSDIAPYCDAVSFHNEIWANSQTAAEQRDRIMAAQAAVHVWNDEYRHTFSNDIRVIIGEAAIGNWMPRAVAAVAIETDNLLGYHPYEYWRNKVRGDEGFLEATSRLWDSMELDWGLRPNWIFTEAGPFEACETGWRSPICLDHDRAAYVNAVRTWIRDVAQTPAYREGRIAGFALFTTGGGDRWSGFETEQPELNDLAEMIRVEWKPGTSAPPPPPPPPPPVEDRGKPRIQYPRVYNVIPQDATEARAVEIFRLGWNKAKQTSGGSYDDAGVGDLDNRTAVLWDIPADKQEVYRAWFATWYAGTHVEFASGGDPEFFLVSPVEGIPLQVTSAFGVPRSYGPHEGLDLRAKDAAGRSVLILAVADGDVTWASNLRRSSGQPSDYGNHVIVQHDNGLITWSCHLANMTVQAGDRVLQGQVLGLAGSTGNSTGVHLHLTIQWPGHGLSGYIIGDALDPAPLLGL